LPVGHVEDLISALTHLDTRIQGIYFVLEPKLRLPDQKLEDVWKGVCAWLLEKISQLNYELSRLTVASLD